MKIIGRYLTIWSLLICLKTNLTSQSGTWTGGLWPVNVGFPRKILIDLENQNLAQQNSCFSMLEFHILLRTWQLKSSRTILKKWIVMMSLKFLKDTRLMVKIICDILSSSSSLLIIIIVDHHYHHHCWSSLLSSSSLLIIIIICFYYYYYLFLLLLLLLIASVKNDKNDK